VSESTFETIVIERRGHTACIRLDRPEVLNAINDEMIAEINQVAAELEADPEVWTIILTGTGRALCSGADVNKAGDEQKGNYTSGLDPQGEPLLLLRVLDREQRPGVTGGQHPGRDPPLDRRSQLQQKQRVGHLGPRAAHCGSRCRRSPTPGP